MTTAEIPPPSAPAAGPLNLTAIGPNPASRPGSSIDYELFLDCVHCGLCTASCPTYVETGNENDSPRGRIYLMRAVRDGRLDLTHEVRRHLELCLDCRACETACPSGVQYGKLIEPFRIEMEAAGGEQTAAKSHDWFHRIILFGMFPYPEKLRQALIPARWAQRLGLEWLLVNTGLWRLLPARLGRMATLLPKLEKPSPPLPAFLAAKGRRRARVALFTGCVGDALFRQTNWATARVLQENGCDVVVPAGQACCGAIHFHGGASEPARDLADANVQSFDASGVDAIIVNVAGCGSMLKDYGHHWHDERHDERTAFAAKVKDVSEFLDGLGLIQPPGHVKVTATYHDACHLAHAQKVREQPRNLLKKVPGLKLVDLAESELCCGAAGTYNLTEPEMAERLARRKLDNIRRTGARVVITANAGCLLQIAREARMQGEVLKILHPMEILDLSYRRESVKF
ncbi:MAG: (Fe-S)-binding protein [Pirellulaceae bacterium]|nr:(Fe-S)-binding protein [Pirellulaceae bacterium]